MDTPLLLFLQAVPNGIFSVERGESKPAVLSTPSKAGLKRQAPPTTTSSGKRLMCSTPTSTPNHRTAAKIPTTPDQLLRPNSVTPHPTPIRQVDPVGLLSSNFEPANRPKGVCLEVVSIYTDKEVIPTANWDDSLQLYSYSDPPCRPDGHEKSSLSLAWRKCIKSYAKGLGRYLNYKMEQGLVCLERDSEAVHMMTGIMVALQMIKKPFKGTVFRGVDLPKDPDFVYHLLRAKVLKTCAFLSTSHGKLHQKFANRTCRFIITSKTGKYISDHAVDNFEYENEVLFPPGNRVSGCLGFPG